MRILVLISISASLCACGDEAGGTAEGDIVRLDDASDEVLITLRDAVDRGLVTTDDEAAARLVAPADGAELPKASAPAFTWALPESQLRHGRNTGDFVWVGIDCPGLDEPIDILGIETTEWQPDGDRWAKLQTATGPCDVGVISAYVDRGVVAEGPYQPSASSTFTIAP